MSDNTVDVESPIEIEGEVVIPAVSAGENNVIETIKVNGEALPVEDKTVDISVPTKTSQLTNDSDFAEESDLSRVAFTGSYRDLVDTPTIPDVPTKTSDLVNDSGFITKAVNDLDNYTRTNRLGAVALTNDYDDLDNKPVIPTVPTKTSDLTNDSGFITKAVNNLENYPKANEFSPVAFSGAYGDLNGVPNIPQVTVTQKLTGGVEIGSVKVDNNTTKLYAPAKVTATSQLENDGEDGTSYFVEKSELATVATSGSYNDLTNKPTMTTVTVTQVETTGTKIATIKVNNVTTDLFAPEGGGSGSQIQSDWTQNDTTKVDYIKHKPNLKAVATSGSYNDLTDTPTIPAAQIQSDWTQADNTKKDYIKNKPSLATVATSGSYNDLTNKPTIPTQTTVTVTQIESTGTHIADITVNGTTTEIYAPEGGDTQIQSDWAQTDTTAKDYIKNKPTKLSDFTNDEGFIDNAVNNLTNYTLSSSLSTVATSGSYNDLSNKPTIPVVPTNVSDFANDAGYITKSVNDLENYTLTSSLSAVATSGDYEDLSNTPAIPAFVLTTTSSSSTAIIAADSIVKFTAGLTIAALTVSSDTTQLHEWAGKFTTGASQTSVSITMSDSSTIEWSSDTSNLMSNTSYQFSVVGNDMIGYTGVIVPLIY